MGRVFMDTVPIWITVSGLGLSAPFTGGGQKVRFLCFCLRFLENRLMRPRVGVRTTVVAVQRQLITNLITSYDTVFK